jgi:integrase
VNPSIASHLLAVYRLLPKTYRLPLLVLDATGMRVGELEALRWGDVDEPGCRWRVSGTTAKTRQGRLVPVDPTVFAAVVALVPREDRDPDARVFPKFVAHSFRQALGRACKAAAVPAFSPHDLRHPRCTLWQLDGVPTIMGAQRAGHSAQEHMRTYGHAMLADRTELDYAEVLDSGQERSHGGVTVRHGFAESAHFQRS